MRLSLKSEAEHVNALTLLSGGLDSRLSIRLLQEQGVHVEALTFSHALFDVTEAKAAATQLEVPHHVVDVTPALMKALDRTGPEQCRDGRPCQVLHAEMLRRAKGLLREWGCHFLVTGERLGRRLPWQTVEGFAHVDRAAGCEGLVLRPLSAQLLAETEPEKNGWVDRAAMGALEGRCERERMALAARYHLSVSDRSPTDCCMLDVAFSARAQDLKQHEGLQGVRSVQWLRMGRHFRVGDRAKLVLGRNAGENAELEGSVELYDLLLKPDGVRGPVAILPFTATEEEVVRAAAICARYSDAKSGEPVNVRIRSARDTRWIETAPAPHDEIERCRVT